VELAWAAQDYTGEQARQAAQDNGIDLQIVKLPEVKKGFVLPPKRWVGSAVLDSMRDFVAYHEL
jgi:anti-sigma factor ChrR (cupin superfamily)